MDDIFFKSLAVVASVYTLYMGIQFRKHPEKLIEYVSASPKAYLWKKFFGEEKTAYLIKTYFFPIGMVISMACLAVIAASLVVALI